MAATDTASRICGNSAILFVRTALVAICGAAAVRIAVGALGADGYGTYAAVSALVGTLVLFNGVMEQTARRFLGCAMGRGGPEELQTAFSSLLVLSLTLAVLMVAVGETIGLWYLVRRLSVPPEYSSSALVCYHLGVFLAAASAVSVPFSALMVSGERMSFFLVVGAVESAAAIAAALVAKMRGVNGVEVFAGVLAAGSALSLVVHIVCCRAVFPGVRLRLSCPAARLREAAAFLSWGTLSSVGNAVKYKGTSLVVNGFAGVAFNATWDVAIKAWQYLHGFCADFMQAFSPVLFKAWGAGERRRVASVAAWTTFASFLIAAVPSAVVFAFAPELVRVWLGEAAPPQVAAFVRCSVVNLVFDAASNPLTTTILASGRVALYHSVACSLSVLGFAVAWLLLASGFPAWTSMAAVAATNGLALAYRALHVRFILRRNSSGASTAT